MRYSTDHRCAFIKLMARDRWRMKGEVLRPSKDGDEGNDSSDRPSSQGFVQTDRNLRGQDCNGPEGMSARCL